MRLLKRETFNEQILNRYMSPPEPSNVVAALITRPGTIFLVLSCNTRHGHLSCERSCF